MASAPGGPFETLRFYWRIAIRPYPREATGLLLLIVGSAVFDMISVGLTVPLLDALTDPARASASLTVRGFAAALQSVGIAPSSHTVIFALMVIVSIFFIARSSLLLWSQCRASVIAVTMRTAMKLSLFEKFLYARYEEVTKRARGVIVNDINRPAETIASSVITLGSLWNGLFTSALMIALLVYLSWWATVLVGVLAVAGVQGWRWYADRRASDQGRLLYDLHSEQSKRQVDAIDGTKVVKAHGLERKMLEEQDKLLRAEWQPELQLAFFRNGPMLVNEVTAVAIVLVLGAVTFLVPSMGIRFSMLGAFLLAMRRIAPSMASVNTASVILSQYRRNLEKIEEVMQAIPQERRGGAAIGPVTDVRLDHVSFAYASRPDYRVLSEITAAMTRGTVTAVVGPTGAGKSTIASLLLELYEPQAGSILVNGAELRGLDLAAWRRRVGYVSQDIFVFNASIRDNIALGDDRVPAAQTEWAAEVAQLHDFVASLPEGYSTVIGDRGLRLSGGQCQRLAIARAILRRPDVLIFDEATSALDNLTERAVYEAISTLHQEAITLVIAHRLSTIRDADQILVLQAGRVVERGTHDTLVSQRGVYAQLYEEGDRAGTAPASEPAVTNV